MRLIRLKLPKFRNLLDFEICFTPTATEEDGSERAFKSHAIIGQNGSGKSNLLEAIITIFRDLDLDDPSTLDYELDYNICDLEGDSHHIELKASKGKRPHVVIDGQASSVKVIADNPNTYLPAHIFAYYSGKNERIEALFQPHLQRFNRLMRMAAEDQIPSHLLEKFSGTESEFEDIEKYQSRLQARKRRLGEDRLRRLFHCRGGHTQLVLLACLLSDDAVFADILKDLEIIELESALFVLKQPHNLRNDVPELNVRNGDPRFWFAAGTVVSEFLDKLWRVALAPIDDTANKQVDFRGRHEKQEQLYLFVPDKASLKMLGEQVGPPEAFFRYAEGAYIADLIEEVRIKVIRKDVEGNLAYEQLSEGELQLLTVLGLMRITHKENCLFLLDEPDTHLNPIWKLNFFTRIEEALQQSQSNSPKRDSQVIITTHDPLMIGSLRKEQVCILRCEGGKSTVSNADEHPQGMGVAGLLKSELFGLPSTLDTHTLKQLQRRNELIALKAKEALTPKQESELKSLRAHLDDLGFSREYRDPLYQRFIEQMYAVRSIPLDELFSPDELKQQEELAQQILRKLVKVEKTAELSALAKELKISSQS